MGNIYYNGDIITLTDKVYPQALYEKDGFIKYVGDVEDIKKICKDDDCWVDISGKTLCPAFIDSHSHITALSSTLRYCNLSSAKSFLDIQNLLKEFAEKRGIKKGNWIVGFGYDNNFLEEKSHPNKDVLDIFTENPVVITHVSGHMGVANTKALEIFNIDKNTENPSGGVIGKDENGEVTGYLEETAFINATKIIKEPDFDEKVKLFKEAEKIYASNGIVTVQDGFSGEKEAKFLKELSENGSIDLDVVMYCDIKNSVDMVEEYREFLKEYRNNLKLGGYKMFLDGSPQGRTAFMREPYADSEDYRGYPVYKDLEVVEFFKKAIDKNVQVIGHSNSDGACQQFINSYDEALKNCGEKNIRPVMIHSQLLGIDQLDDVKRLNIIPSYFASHIYYWGEIHKKNFGKERGENICPLNSTLERGIIFTMHTDTPVIMPNLIEEMWCAVNRISKDGNVLSENERIEPIEALKSITINSAYQYFEEDKKGSLEVGKYADLVILDRNPLKVKREDIKDISVLENIKRGESVFKK